MTTTILEKLKTLSLLFIYLYKYCSRCIREIKIEMRLIFTKRVNEISMGKKQEQIYFTLTNKSEYNLNNIHK